MQRNHKLLATAIALLTVQVGCGEADETSDEMVVDTSTVVETAPGATASTGFLDPNTAAAADLRTAGVDSTVAAAVEAGRPYSDNLAVDRVLAQHNLTDTQRDSVFAHVWIPIDPNTATAEEIMLIPGVGEQMEHEFEEYRPWTSLEQFRREIGKYVDDEEVARLERYIVIR